MSIQNALYTSLSSLQVLGQQSQLISNNVANASTPGFAQEQLNPSAFVANGIGSGVLAGKITLLASQAATASANQAASLSAYSQEMVGSLSTYTSALGSASSSTTLSSQLSAFQTALTTLSSAPSNGTDQTQTVTAAQGLVGTFHSLNDTVETLREQADQSVASGVTNVNNLLDQLAQNQNDMKAAAANGQPTADFQNVQNGIISSLSQYLPVQVQQGPNGNISVGTDQGTTLYDGTVHKLSFAATPVIPSTMRVTANAAAGLSGGLSQVTVSGQPISMSASGSIAANLKLRDVTLPGYSDQLDKLAGNLVATFQTADPTVSAGQTGLFTAGGSALNTGNPAAIAGLSGSIAVNAAVDPSQGGQSWKVQAGVQATSQGNAADGSVIIGFINALQSTQSATAVSGLPNASSLSDAVSQVEGNQQADSANWTTINTGRTQASQTAQTALSNATGVNIDDQMQRLLIVQQSYQASAEVIQTVSSMMNSLLTVVQQNA